MRQPFLKAAASVLAIGLITAACSSATPGTDDPGNEPGTPAAVTTDSGASSLRATLTAALQEHVYLAGIAINTAVGTGLDSDATAAAVGTLDENSKALSAAIDSVYPGAGKTFLPLWRKHIDFFVDYTKAGAGGDEAGQAKARKDLDGYRADFGAFLAGANPNLTKDAVADALVPHVDSVFDAIDAVLSGSTTVFAKLQTAASHMPGTAAVLAGAISDQFPEKFDGDSDGGAASLRATLTSALQEHVYLAGIAINTAVSTGLDSKSTAAAVKVLDGNSKALSDAVDSVYAGAGKTFLPLWRKHIDFFVDYTVAGAGGDDAGQAKARKGLDDYRADFGAFLAGANPNLTKSAVAQELIPHVNSVFDTIDAVLAGSTDIFSELQKAASVMPGTANVLAGAIAGQFPEMFS